MFRKTMLVAAVSCVAVPAQSQGPIRHMLANFDRIDANRDGVISRAEVRAVQALRWTQIDRNGDGYLSEGDFPPAAAGRARAHLAGIAHLDENGDGRISQGEFLNGPETVFTQADRNSDGVLTRFELDV